MSNAAKFKASSEHVESKCMKVRTLSEAVMEQIGQWIFDGTLAKGQRIVLKKVADELGVSEMPVREALKMLEAQGLVESVPYRGAWVRELSPEDIEELYMLRELLESKAAEVAVMRMTPEELAHLEHLAQVVEESIDAGDSLWYFQANQEFHFAFYSASKLRHVCEHIRSIWRSLAYYRLVHSTPFMIEYAREEHEQYLDAARRRDPDKIKQLVSESLRQHAAVLVEKYKTHNTNSGATSTRVKGR